MKSGWVPLVWMVSMAGTVVAAEPPPAQTPSGLSGDWVLTTVTYALAMTTSALL